MTFAPDGPEPVGAERPTSRVFKTTEIIFSSDDGTTLFGKLTTPTGGKRHPVVIWVQTAEAQTVDTRVLIADGKVIEYFDLYRECLATMNVAFFSYEGRGVRSGSQAPRYVDIDRPIFDSSTLEHKVRDAVGAVDAIRRQASIDDEQILLMGASEGTLLAAETAARLPGQIKALVLQSVLTELREALRFIFTDGMFMQHCQHWDADNDGVITRAEFEADPSGIRRLIPGVGFEVFDLDGDGLYTREDRRRLSKPVIDALDVGDIDVINASLKPVAGVQLPAGWVADHFRHPPTWAFLSQLDIPVGIFHGEMDTATPVDGARALAQLAGKTNFEFHFFPGFGHDLGDLDYFNTGAVSEPNRVMFEHIKRNIRN